LGKRRKGKKDGKRKKKEEEQERGEEEEEEEGRKERRSRPPGSTKSCGGQVHPIARSMLPGQPDINPQVRFVHAEVTGPGAAPDQIGKKPPPHTKPCGTRFTP